MNLGNNLVELRRLFSIRDTLASFMSLDLLLRASVQFLQEQTNSQTAALFLLSKDGMLQRKALIGIDKHGETISSDWFCEEQYLPGASFSGKAVTAKGKVRFGEPQWAANLQGDDLDPKSFKKYKEKLGAVSCAAAVPLNGSNRTFGVLEIVNKHPNSEISQFTIDDLHWLSILGLTTAFAISILRHRDRLAAGACEGERSDERDRE